MIAGTPRYSRHHAIEAERRHIQRVDERLDHVDRVVLRHVVVQAIGK
jgi:hypothetical protein